MEAPDLGSSGSQTDVVDTQDNWFSSFSSATDTPGADDDTANAAAKSLSPGSKLPLTSTKSAPDSLIAGSSPTLPAGKPDLVSPVSAGGDVFCSSLIASDVGQKLLGELPSRCPTKCK